MRTVCGVKIKTAADFRQEQKDAAMALSKEKRQEFMDYFWSGLTIGEAREKAGISNDAAMGVMDMNLRQCTYLRRETE